jgi:hypothetical protein
MTVEDLKALRDRRPFTPFTIHLSDGRSFDVPAPGYFAPHPGAQIALVWHAVGQGYSFIAIDAITHVSDADAPLSATIGA